MEYLHKLIREEDDRIQKIWFTEDNDQLHFRIVSRSDSADCYQELEGLANKVISDELENQDDDYGNAHFVDEYLHEVNGKTLRILVEMDERTLCWLRDEGVGVEGLCDFESTGPLMPEVAG